MIDNDEKNIEKDQDSENLQFSIPIKKSKKSANNFERLKTYIQNVNNFQKRDFEVVNFKSKLVKFNFLFKKQNTMKKLAWLIFLSLSMSITTLLLVQNSGLYSSGVAGIFQAVARFSQAALRNDGVDLNTVNLIYNIMFWGFYLLANIPLLIFAHKKISKQFAYLTFLYILMNQIFGLCFSFIPGIEDINIFGSTSYISDNVIINEIGLKLAEWNGQGAFSLFIYAVVCSLIVGIQYAFLYIIGGSSGGTDVASFYFAKKKNKSIGFMLAIINTLCLLVSVLFGSVASLILIDPNTTKDANTLIQIIFSPNLVFSIFLTIMVSFSVNYYFPKSKFTQIKIYTNDATALKNKMILMDYKHDIFINEMLNAMDDKPIFTLETICMYIELPDILSIIRSIDLQAMISINRLSDVDGDMFIFK